MLIDSHVHTRFSTDSKMTIEEALEVAKEKGIGFIVTEHLDLDYPEAESFLFDLDQYFSEYEPYRDDNLGLGVEIGMVECLEEKYSQIISAYPFDFVIGSIHVVDTVEVHVEEFSKLGTKRKVYEKYFKAMNRCLESYDIIDSLGHIDYIARYSRFVDQEIYYEEFHEHIDPVLKVLVEKEKALEINTRRLTKKEIITALLPIYKRFRTLGGTMVTIGSDAHVAKDVGKGMAEALEIAEQSNLKVVSYSQRKPEYINL
ncbi:histidinol phosphate phosphatase [Heliorestis acidaminivorans]|uniref:Histidinol-phosphatase n=1 Tax=Heliorestis acidaminivorans TaxID=553427 RepID=A0A6I0F0F6_9FIRM|nr:histidinol phosphate phosphatase [Heliorestis acidaminivorans]KAB2951785.1 histidinol phosphate phosphatase [Heliorestis acidaminivorans]